MIVLAGLACAWFVLGIRQAHEISVASAIVSRPGPLGPADAAHASALLKEAKTLNPDLEVDVLRGRLASAEHHLRQARQILGTVTKREPKNLDAWLWLAHASGYDPVSFYAADLAIDSLVPPIKGKH